MGLDLQCPHESRPLLCEPVAVCNAADLCAVLRTPGLEFDIARLSTFQTHRIPLDTSHAPTETAFASNR
jgi:hypothetical protein